MSSAIAHYKNQKFQFLADDLFQIEFIYGEKEKHHIEMNVTYQIPKKSIIEPCFTRYLYNLTNNLNEINSNQSLYKFLEETYECGSLYSLHKDHYFIQFK